MAKNPAPSLMVIKHVQGLYTVVSFHCWDRRNPSDYAPPPNPSILFTGIQNCKHNSFTSDTQISLEKQIIKPF